MLVGSSFVKCVRNKKRYHMHVEIKKKSSRIQTTPRIVQQQRWQGCRDRHYSNEWVTTPGTQGSNQWPLHELR